MKKFLLLVAALCLVLASLTAPAPAMAAGQVAWMSGLGGVRPDYASITPPVGLPKCNPASGCPRVTYDNMSPDSAKKAITAWVTKVGKSGNTMYTYSASTLGATLYLNDPANFDDQNNWILLGSPATPGNWNNTSSWIPLNAQHGGASVRFEVVQYDSVADLPAGTAYDARRNATLGEHTRGYDDLNLAVPDAIFTDPVSGAKVNYFLTYPLPVINEWFKSSVTVLNEDKSKRANVESQYYLPGKSNRLGPLPNPW